MSTGTTKLGQVQNKLLAFLRSRPGRLVVASLGIGAVCLLIAHAGAGHVAAAIARVTYVFPIVLVFEAGIIATEQCALRLLYGPDRHRIPRVEFVRVGLIGYAIASLVPIGRAVAEGVKATMLSRFTSGARAASAMARFQGVALLANTVISVPCTLAALALVRHSFVPIAIAGNGLLTLVLGAGVLIIGSRSRVGAWLASKTDRAKHFGPALDEMLRNDSRLPWASLGWCVLARFCQVCQYTVLLMAMGHARALIAGFCAEGVALVGTAIGEIIPAQIGAIEFNFTISAAALGISTSDALALPILTHLSLLVWTVVGSLVPLLWPPPSVESPSPSPIPSETTAR